MRALGCSLLFVMVCGCPTSTTQTGDSGSTVDAAPMVDTGAPAADTGSGPCAYVDTLDRGCTTDGDCAIGLHQTNCCGSSVMIGYRSTHTEVPALESQCMASYPACSCPATLPTTDSGETVTDTGMVHAACVSVGPTMLCRTYVNNRPPNGT